jgi:hypothetical protein
MEYCEGTGTGFIGAMRKGLISFHSNLSLILCKVMNEFPVRLAISRQKSTANELKGSRATVRCNISRRGEYSSWPRRPGEFLHFYLQRAQPAFTKSLVPESANLTIKGRANG